MNKEEFDLTMQDDHTKSTVSETGDLAVRVLIGYYVGLFMIAAFVYLWWIGAM